MNKIVTMCLILLFSTVLLFAENNTVSYTFMVQVPGLLVQTGTGTINEGESFTVSSYAFSSYPIIQEAYDAIAGSKFEFNQNSIDENVELSITMKNFNSDQPGYQLLLNHSLFIYFEIAVVGANSGPHPTSQSYILNNPAVLTIPLTPKFLAFIAKCGISADGGLGVAYYDGTSLTSAGINSEMKDTNSDGIPDVLKVSISHFSKFAGGGGKTFLTTDVSDGNIDLHAKEYKLNQNYPNPFNPSTKISYSLPKDGYVALKVYNAIGAEVRSLVSGYQNAGSHELVFNAENLPSGVYFYTLRFDNTTQTKRMILIK